MSNDSQNIEKTEIDFNEKAKEIEAKEVEIKRKEDEIKTAESSLEIKKNELENDVKKFEASYRRHKEWVKRHEQLNQWIDIFILAMLYFLLIISAAYGVINIGVTIYKGTSHSITSIFEQKYQKPQSQGENAADKTDEENLSPQDKSELLILETVEKIFLYLLPLFIMLGFFQYYKNNASFPLVDRSTGGIDEENSTSSVNMTKLLFISSIISYVIIKIVDSIFIKSVTDPTRIISFGVLLLMLMVYYIFLERKNHRTK